MIIHAFDLVFYIMAKSIKKTYFFLIFGGFFGLHHFYLGNDKQAFMCFSTFGGFIFGLLRDFFKIPEYVRETNEKLELTKKELKLKAPAFFTTNFISSVIFGSCFGYILKYSIPFSEEAYVSYLCFKILSPSIIALIIYMNGTEGPLKCKFRWPLIGSYIAFFIDLIKNVHAVYTSAMLATLFLNWNIEWDRDYYKKKKNRKLFRRIIYLSVGFILIASLNSLYLWNNASLEINGKKVTLKESVINFLNSKELVELKEVFKMIWNYYKAHGLQKLINHFFYGLDTEAIANSYKIIEMNEKSSQAELEQRCKSLARKWHPDRFKDVVKKEEAEKQFMSIQESCNILLELRKKKFIQNQKTG